MAAGEGTAPESDNLRRLADVPVGRELLGQGSGTHQGLCKSWVTPSPADGAIGSNEVAPTGATARYAASQLRRPSAVIGDLGAPNAITSILTVPGSNYNVHFKPSRATGLSTEAIAARAPASRHSACKNTQKRLQEMRFGSLGRV